MGSGIGAASVPLMAASILPSRRPEFQPVARHGPGCKAGQRSHRRDYSVTVSGYASMITTLVRHRTQAPPRLRGDGRHLRPGLLGGARRTPADTGRRRPDEGGRGGRAGRAPARQRRARPVRPPGPHHHHRGREPPRLLHRGPAPRARADPAAAERAPPLRRRSPRSTTSSGPAGSSTGSSVTGIVPAVVRGDRTFVQEEHARAQLVVTRIQDLAEALVTRSEGSIASARAEVDAVERPHPGLDPGAAARRAAPGRGR